MGLCLRSVESLLGVSRFRDEARGIQVADNEDDGEDIDKCLEMCSFFIVVSW